MLIELEHEYFQFMLSYIEVLFLFFSRVNICYYFNSYGNIVVKILLLNLDGPSEFPQPFITLLDCVR